MSAIVIKSVRRAGATNTGSLIVAEIQSKCLQLQTATKPGFYLKKTTGLPPQTDVSDFLYFLDSELIGMLAITDIGYWLM